MKTFWPIPVFVIVVFGMYGWMAWHTTQRRTAYETLYHRVKTSIENQPAWRNSDVPLSIPPHATDMNLLYAACACDAHVEDGEVMRQEQFFTLLECCNNMAAKVCAE